MSLRSFNLVLAEILICLVVSGCGQKKADKGVVGLWTREFRGKVETGRLNADGSYIFEVIEYKYPIKGNYTVIDDKIRFIDNECGYKLPGLYSFSRSEKTLVLAEVDDHYCIRKRWMPGTWTKSKQNSKG